MKDDIKGKLSGLLSGIDANTVKKFLDNGGMEKLNSSLSEEDKKRLTSEVMKMDSEEIKKKLQGVDLSGLKNLDIDSIIKKMKQ
ncbi:MAG: hypothetical protein IJ366_10280 [Clostridia bacterium]|nr:hypothetical protein [Clostridia bacterium]